MSSKPSRQLGDILSSMPRATATPRNDEGANAVAALEATSNASNTAQAGRPATGDNSQATRLNTQLASATVRAVQGGEAEVPLQVTVPKHIRKRLLMMATEQDCSMRALILTAVRSLGIEVAEEELRDKRRKS